MSIQIESDNWGSLSFLQSFVQNEGKNAESDKKQSDSSVAKLLVSDEKGFQLKKATLAQFDQVLSSEFFDLRKRPLCNLILLFHKAAKIKVETSGSSKSSAVPIRTDGAHSAAIPNFNQNDVLLLLQQFTALSRHIPLAIALKEAKSLYKLCGNVAQIASDAKLSARILYPLKSLLQRFHDIGFCAITPIHGDFFYLCIQSKHYAAALDIVDLPLVEVEKEHNGMTVVSFLKYGYYSGVIYLSQKLMREAINAFVMTISTPAAALSAFVVEAYKKLILISLIVHGRIHNLPQYVAYVVSRHVDSHCTAYMEFAHAFEQGNYRDLARLAQDYRDKSFIKDGNFGLVKQCLVAFKQQSLINVHRMYNCIPLSDIPAIIGQNVEDWNVSKADIAHLLQTNGNANLSAKIDQEKNLVVFRSDSNFYINKQQQHEIMECLDNGMQRLLCISEHLKKVDAEIVQHPRFIAHLQQDREKRQPRGPSLVGLGLADDTRDSMED
ncbi:unnamed protein product [Albugo candida]|uniref:COP9 signalosome complex subunit 3 N-terminal helical repeats domain-containing protein n=1 Tax=Albugo candida TaxID=65357 RepID=A0A024GG65_9STRA|nr:unnamed protein product [Albugo candida]|eukprot:CCI45508.1 unnamed protein product [Albugo candida]